MESMREDVQIESEYLDEPRVLCIAEAETAEVGGHLQSEGSQFPQSRQSALLDAGILVVARRIVDLRTHAIVARTHKTQGSKRSNTIRYLLEKSLDVRHELRQRLLLVGRERLGVGEHLRRLEGAAEQVKREGGAGPWRRALSRPPPRFGCQRAPPRPGRPLCLTKH